MANSMKRSVNLPQGVTIKEKFEPGFGRSVGSVQEIKGEAFVIHSKKHAAFPLQRQNKLYLKDILITGKESSLRIELSDKSILSLASQTKLKLNRSVYDPQARSRSSFIRMFLGKARFLIKKMMDYKNSEFKVKTNTAIAGVRGSDFIVQSARQESAITALQDTKLEVVSLAYPEETVKLTDREQTRIRKGKRPDPIKKLPKDKIRELKQNIPVGLSRNDQDVKDVEQKEEIRDKKSDSAEDFGDEKVYFSEKQSSEIPKQSLEQPSPNLQKNFFPGQKSSRKIQEEKANINEDVKEKEIKKLPDFPAHPKN